MNAYILVGLPSSGKSTYAKEKNKDGRYYVLSTDAYIESAAAALGKSYSDIFSDYISRASDELWASADHAVSKMLDIIWDQTNLTIQSRKNKITYLKQAGYCVHAVIFEPAADLRKQYSSKAQASGKIIPDDVLLRMAASYRRPTEAEGFDSVTNSECI